MGDKVHPDVNDTLRAEGLDAVRERHDRAHGTKKATVTSLAHVHEVFLRWLGKEYDIATLDAVLAACAAERLPGDPPWLLIISGPGNAKTETVQATSGLGAHIVSTITSDGALLSARPKTEPAQEGDRRPASQDR